MKLLYDEAVLGPVTSEEELMDCLQEYDRDWYVGSDVENKWQEHVLRETPHLFSLGHDKETVRSACTYALCNLISLLVHRISTLPISSRYKMRWFTLVC